MIKIKPVEPYQKLTRKKLILQIAIRLGLGLLTLLTVTGGRLQPTQTISSRDLPEQAVQLSKLPDLRWVNQGMAIALSQVVNLSSADHNPQLGVCLNMDLCPGYPGSPKIKQFVVNPTLPFFNGSIEGVGRLWLMTEQKRYLVVYFKISLNAADP